MEVMAARPSISIKTHNYVSLPLFIQANTNTQQEDQHQESMHPSVANHEEEEEEEKEEVSSESSSSIGQADQSSSEDEEKQVEDEVQSKFKKPLIMSLNSIQEALPIKRGLSNYYNGKSKSFACLSDVMNGKAVDLMKHENPFNKRRRILIATSRRASYHSLIQAHNNNSSSCASLPPLMLSSNFTLEEEKEDDDHNDKLPLEGSSTSSSSSSLVPLSILDTKAFNKSFKSPRSFSLSDLQHV
ncbi:hypothetical protein DsansV1_C21g0169301 [Dioscorea sansibarensis]